MQRCGPGDAYVGRVPLWAVWLLLTCLQLLVGFLAGFLMRPCLGRKRRKREWKEFCGQESMPHTHEMSVWKEAPHRESLNPQPVWQGRNGRAFELPSERSDVACYSDGPLAAGFAKQGQRVGATSAPPPPTLDQWVSVNLDHSPGRLLLPFAPRSINIDASPPKQQLGFGAHHSRIPPPSTSWHQGNESIRALYPAAPPGTYTGNGSDRHPATYTGNASDRHPATYTGNESDRNPATYPGNASDVNPAIHTEHGSARNPPTYGHDESGRNAATYAGTGMNHDPATLRYDEPGRNPVAHGGNRAEWNPVTHGENRSGWAPAGFSAASQAAGESPGDYLAWQGRAHGRRSTCGVAPPHESPSAQSAISGEYESGMSDAEWQAMLGLV